MDTAQWPQEIVVKPLEEIVVTNNTCPKPGGGGGGGNLERKAIRPQKEQALNCPRCNSTNTKFCYYNNYSLTQPRYFCKTCRRYWTEGGSLRNIPVGGGSRKNKRSSTSSNSSSSTSSSSLSKTTRLPDLVQPVHNPKIINQAQDLNLAFPSSAPNTTTHHHQHQHQHHQDFRNISDLIHQLPSNIDKNHSTSATTTTTSTSHLSAMELLTGLTSRGFNSFMPMPVVPDPNTSVYTSGLNFPLQVDFKPTLNFSLDGLGSSGGYASLQGVHEETNGSRLLFPFEDLKQVSSTTTTTGIIEQNKEQADHHQSTGGYWSGMLGGGSW